MHKCVFFTGPGLAYQWGGARFADMEIYPETIAALRLLRRRGYKLVLVSSSYREFKAFLAAIKDKTLPLRHSLVGEENLRRLMQDQGISPEASYFLADTLIFKSLLDQGGKIVLILTGRGIETLNSLEEGQAIGLDNICKDFYTAACYIALNLSASTSG